MQPRFLTYNKKRVKEECGKLIEKAIKDKVNIIFVEYADYGKTIKLLKSKVKWYKNYTVVKENDDGSYELKKFFKNHNESSKRKFKICGVNTDACVYLTVAGLIKRFPKTKIEVISKACDSANIARHKEGLKDMKNLTYKNFKLR